MAEKVYGIIGTNKAMKEVIQKTELLVLETEISGSRLVNLTGNGFQQYFFAKDYIPDEIASGGFDNYIVINVLQKWSRNYYWYPPILPANVHRHYQMDGDKIIIQVINDDESGETERKTLSIRAVLLKVK